MDIFFFIYYLVLLVSMPLFFFAWEKEFFFSVSNLSLIANFLLVSIPGYFVANRALSIENNIDSFYLLFFLYIISSILPPIGIFLGNKFAKNKILIEHIPLTKNFTKRSYCLAFLVCAYSFLYYFYWFRQIPLIYLVLNPFTDKSFLAFLRNAITHDLLTFSTNLPFFLRYWRLIMQQVGLIVFILAYASLRDPQLQKTKRRKLFVFFLGSIVCFNHIMALEKAPIIYLIFSMFSIDLFYKRAFNYKKITFICLLVPLMYIFFMGSSPKNSLLNALSRLTRQNEGIIEQIQIYDKQIEEKPLLLRNFKFPLWDKMFNKEYVNLSSEAYKIKYAVLHEKFNITGTTGNLFIFSLYTSFGLAPAILLYFLYFILLGSFSRLITKKCNRSNNIFNTILLPLLAVYFYSVSTAGITQLFRSSLILDTNLILIFVIRLLLGAKLKFK